MKAPAGLQVVPPPKFRPHLLVAEHTATEDFTVYQPATFTQRWYALTIDIALSTPLDVLVHLPFKRYLERLDAYGMNERYVLLVVLLWVIPTLLCFVAPTLLWGQTLGKRIVGIRVVRASFNPNIPVMDVILRETVGRILSLLLLGTGFLMAAFTDRHRALHDFLAKTQVITYRVR
jgi:uncharacterized RDD family membrane protein YckC